jgi:hypothetical protein
VSSLSSFSPREKLTAVGLTYPHNLLVWSVHLFRFSSSTPLNAPCFARTSPYHSHSLSIESYMPTHLVEYTPLVPSVDIRFDRFVLILVGKDCGWRLACLCCCARVELKLFYLEREVRLQQNKRLLRMRRCRAQSRAILNYVNGF